jgi:hypothetical protein
MHMGDYNGAEEGGMVPFTDAMRQAIDASLEIPARVINPATQDVQVLLRAGDFQWIRNLLGDEADAPRVLDPRTDTEYALLPLPRYERFKSFFEEDPLSPAEKMALLRAAGERVGWDDTTFDEPNAQGRP